MEALYANSYGKIKSRKKTLGKENEKAAQRKKKKFYFVKQRKKNLAESDKDSWFVRRFLEVLFFSGTFSAFNPFGTDFAFAFTFSVFAQ